MCLSWKQSFVDFSSNVFRECCFARHEAIIYEFWELKTSLCLSLSTNHHVLGKCFNLKTKDSHCSREDVIRNYLFFILFFLTWFHHMFVVVHKKLISNSSEMCGGVILSAENLAANNRQMLAAHLKLRYENKSWNIFLLFSFLKWRQNYLLDNLPFMLLMFSLLDDKKCI